MAALGAGLLVGYPAAAAELLSVEVQRNKGMVHVESELRIDAPPAEVFRALSDYDHLGSLSKRIKISRSVEPAADGTRRVYTLIKGCVWFFCRSVERYARVVTTGIEKIEATVEPEHSDFAYGHEVWLIQPVGEGALVSYRHDFDPNFWVPPILGVSSIRRTLKADALSAAARIEQRAKTQSALRNSAQRNRSQPQPESPAHD